MPGMGKSRTTVVDIWSELLRVGLYKPNKGRRVRQLTALALGLVVFIGAFILSQTTLMNSAPAVKWGVPWGISLVGAWVIYRFVNYQPFADFLISVETEMDVVHWPPKSELYRATIVVIVTMISLAIVLYALDIAWYQILSAVRVLRI